MGLGEDGYLRALALHLAPCDGGMQNPDPVRWFYHRDTKILVFSVLVVCWWLVCLVVLRCLVLLPTATHHPYAHLLLITASLPPPGSVLNQDESKADDSADRWTRAFGWNLFWGVGVLFITLSLSLSRRLSFSNAVHHTDFHRREPNVGRALADHP